MKKWIIPLIIILITVQLVSGICCEKGKDCIISETCQEGDCGNCTSIVYNTDGSERIPVNNMTLVTSLTYIYNISKNLTDYGNYPYTISCTNNQICQGDCQVEIKADCGEKGKMETGIIFMLIIINLFIFILPFLVSFSKNKAADYVVRHLLWIAAIFILWFNMTIFRTMAVNYGLGIDNFLLAYWWIFTLGAFAGVLIMVYVTTIGAIKLMKQIRFDERMGNEEGRETSENS